MLRGREVRADLREMMKLLIQRLGRRSSPSVQGRRPLMPRFFWAAIIVVGGLAVLTGCERVRREAAHAAVVPVTVARASTEDVPVRLEAIGSVQTISTVS